jgi:hypothetical protein
MSSLKTTNILNPSSTTNNIVLAADGSTTISTLTATTIQGTIKSGTAVASTSGTSIDFTGIPSWVKRVTVAFYGVSTNGSSNPLVQIGSGSLATSGYVANSGTIQNAGSSATNSYTAGFGLSSANASNVIYATMTIVAIGSSNYVQSHAGAITTSGVFPVYGGGGVNLSGTLDRVRITTVNGTDTFDAGSINILFEG